MRIKFASTDIMNTSITQVSRSYVEHVLIQLVAVGRALTVST